MNRASTKFTERVVAIVVDLHRPGTKRRLAGDEVDAGDMDKSLLRASKIVLESPTLRAVRREHGQLKRYLRRKTLIGARKGVFFVPKADVENTVRRIRAAEETTRELALRFKSEYPELILRMKAKLRGRFRKSDYVPIERVADEFGVDWDFIEFNAVPSGLPESLGREARARLDASIRKTGEAFASLLRERFARVVERLAARLAPTADGRRPAIRDSLIDGSLEALADLRTCNVVDDAELDALVTRAQGLLKGVNAEALRDDDALRERTARAFTAMEDGAVAALVKDGPVRRIRVRPRDAA